jgi:hypothetical protein
MEVSKMPGMSQVIYDHGVTEGISQGISQGRQQEKDDNVKQLVEYFMSQDDKLTKEEATQMAKGILK